MNPIYKGIPLYRNEPLIHLFPAFHYAYDSLLNLQQLHLTANTNTAMQNFPNRFLESPSLYHLQNKYIHYWGSTTVLLSPTHMLFYLFFVDFPN